MSPRRYDRKLRLAAAEEAKRRIVEAAAALHSKYGGMGTSHAMIAQEAGVSIPTVYKYFPTRDDLIPACTGLVASKAPVVLDGRLFDGLREIPERVQALARALFRLHEYYGPWIRFTEADAAEIPALREYLEAGRKARLELVRLALSPEGEEPAPETLVQLAHVLLEAPSWRTLTASTRSTERAAAMAADAVITLYRRHRR
jgi:AcrR family transcriptional regulator